MFCRWLLFVLFCLPAVPAQAADLSQRQWMVQLVDSLGWTFGLPDEPTDEDYLRLLSGERRLLLEAEDFPEQAVPLSVKRITNYGEYSGAGWVSGLRQPVQIKGSLLVPHAGVYQLAVATRQAGVRLQLAGHEFLVPGSERFSRQELGPVVLSAGETELLVTLPPQAGIDYIELTAGRRRAIAPLRGWAPDQKLTAEGLALTTLQALELLDFLPEAGPRQVVEAETASNSGLPRTRDRHLGAPSGGEWLRAGNRPGALELPLRLPGPGCYRLYVGGHSEQPVSFRIPGLWADKALLGPSLALRPLGTFCAGERFLSLQAELPAWAGIDRLAIIPLDSREERLRQLIGVPEEGALSTELVNRVLALLSSLSR